MSSIDNGTIKNKYYYGNDGVSKIENYESGVITSNVLFTYTSGKPTLIQVIRVKDNKITLKYDMSYNNQGRLIKTIKDDGLNKKSYTYEYDSNNRVIKENNVDNNGISNGALSYTSYDYDSNDNIIKSTAGDGGLTSTVTYDSKINYQRKNNIVFPISNLLFSGNNNPINASQVEKILNQTPKQYNYKYDLTYDTESKLTQMVSSKDGKLAESISYQYEKY